jgi:hemoglobin
MTPTLDESLLPPLLDRFYATVQTDPLLGPVFQDAVADWPHHLARLRDFWSSVMLTTGRYKGNPMAMHLKHAPRIQPAMFARWLTLWHDATKAMLPPEVATVMQAKAARIAESLQMALRPLTPPQDDTPYRSSPEFTQDTLPPALCRAHTTKAGVWGVIRVLEGQLRLTFASTGASLLLDPATPGLVRPEQVHHVTPLGAMRMRVDFYATPPALSPIAGSRAEVS